MSQRTYTNGYAAKIEFWTEQLTYSRDGVGNYSIARCEDSLQYFTDKHEALLKRRVDTATESMTEARTRRERLILDGRIDFTDAHQEAMSEAINILEEKIVKDFLSYPDGESRSDSVRHIIARSAWESIRSAIKYSTE